MKSRFFLGTQFVILVLSMVGFIGFANAQQPQAQILKYLDISTGNGLKLDIHAPLSTKKKGFFGKRKLAPILLYVHGGGWIKGSRKKSYRLPRFATSRGIMLVSVDYRPVPKTDIDGQVRDVVQGINWVRKNIKRYGGDPKRIVIMGHSAGSHLVALISARKVGGQLAGVIPNDVQAYDMLAYGGMRGSLPRVYAMAFGSNVRDWVKWSPVTYVRRNSGFPPHLIMHSGSNGERRRALANGFAAELRRKGTKVYLFDGRRYSHGAIAARIGSSPEVTNAVASFLRKVF